MRSLSAIIIALSFFSFSLISCEQKEATEKTEENIDTKMETGVQYTCPMHPEDVTDKPGTCPNCGMV